MPRIGVAIMSHRTRLAYVEEMVDKIRSVGRWTHVIVDTENNEWDTGRRAWLSYRNADYFLTHWLVLQDDAIICNNLVRGVEHALERIPRHSPLSLYFGQARPMAQSVSTLADLARKHDASFIRTNKINWGVGLVIPTATILPMIDWCDRRSDPMYDRRLSKFFVQEGIPVYNTWPSLVDHRHDIPSILGHAREERRAHEFIGSDASASDVQWTGPIVRARTSQSKRVP